VGRAFRNFFSFFRRIGRRSSNHSGQRAWSRSSMVLDRFSMRRGGML
jgi:E3 ubiquitin-protein ligase RNF115/126